MLFCLALNAQNTWTQKDFFKGSIRIAAVSFSIGNKAYIGTGYNNPSRKTLNDFWEWDKATNTWLKLDSFPGVARGWALASAANGKGYITQGSDNDENGIVIFGSLILLQIYGPKRRFFRVHQSHKV
ncbi:MAG: kelch repeat-containing protein [Bacteroidota bacterium]|nr:kelch repeat-containing protein [Bacteroidota bacterium]